MCAKAEEEEEEEWWGRARRVDGKRDCCTRAGVFRDYPVPRPPYVRTHVYRAHRRRARRTT